MPVSFSSPPRNLFLLGSSGADVVSNFFAAVDGIEPGFGYDVWIPDEIRIGDKFGSGVSNYFAGTGQDTNSKKVGFINEQRYYEYYPTNDPNNPPDNVSLDRKYFINTDTSTSLDTTLRAMELFGSAPNHELIVVGKTGSVPWIAKYIENDQTQWVSTSNTADVEYTGVCKGGTNYYACGSTAVSGDAVSFVEKFDSNGNPGWGKSATMLGRDVVLEKITANSRDEIIAVGYLEDDTADKGYIVKIDANTGEILWDRSLERNISGSGNSGGNGNDDIASADVRCTACYIDGNDFIYVVGSIDGKNPVNNGVGEFLVKYSPEGNILWQRENHTDHYTAVDGAPNMIPFDVKSDTDTQQTVVLSVENQGSFASNNSDIFISKYSKDGTLVFRRQISKGGNTLGNASLDADPSFYYVLFTDQQTVPISGTPDRYFFGRVSTSGNGLGAFQYDDGGTVDTTPIDYTIVSNENKIGRLSDGSVRNDISDFVTYPFTANKLVFDDLATPVSNKKKQMDSADSFEYGGSPAIRPADNPILSFGSQEKTVTTTSGSAAQGQQAYTNPGSYTWTAPANVTSVSVVCVGAGGAGGGALAYKNNITVVPGNNYGVVVGAPGSMGTGTFGTAAGQNTGTSGGNSTFTATHGTTIAQGGITGTPNTNDPKGSPAGDYDGGGNGGITYNYGGYSGGGAGGYSGDGGGAGPTDPSSGVARPGSGGGGGAGSWAYNSGGGVNILGEGASGAGNTNGDGFGGSGGQDGQGEGTNGGQVRVGGNYGGGASGRWAGNKGGEGAVRIIWGTARSFPSTLTADVTPSSGPTTTTTTTLIDMTGNGNDGVVDGATQDANDHWGFDASNQNHIDVPNFTSANNIDFSIEVWWQADSLPSYSNPTSKGYIFDQTPVSDGVALRISTAGDITTFAYPTGGGAVVLVNSGTTVQTGVWYHTVSVFETNKVSLYVNGILVGTSTGTMPSVNAGVIDETYPFTIGSGIDSSVARNYEYFDGKMGEFRIYQKVLTAAQISQNYNATKSKYINEASNIGVKIGNPLKYNGLILNYDFGNKFTYDEAQNLILNSNDLSSSYWQIGGGQGLPTTTQDALSPVGDLTAWTIDDTATGSDGQGMDGNVSGLTASSTQTYTMSVYAKKGTAAKFDIYCFFKPNVRGTRLSYTWDTNQIFSNGSDNGGAAPVSTGQEYVGNGWYRIWMEVVDSTLGTNTELEYRIYPASRDTGPTGSTLFWNPQVVNGSTPGRYIKTYGSAITAPTIVKNLSSSSFSGTADGCTFNSGGYFEFDGVNDEMNIAHSSNMAFTDSLMSIEAWVYIDTLVNGGKEFSIVNKRGNNSTQNNNRPYVFGVNGDGKIRWILDGASTVCDTPTGLIQTGQWYHLVATHDGTDAKIYVNDSLNTTVSSGTTSLSDTGNVPTRIGYRYRNSDVNYSDGRIGELRMYNRALTSGDIAVNFLYTKKKYGL